MFKSHTKGSVLNILIIAHERSLNKSEALINAYYGNNIYLVIEQSPNQDTMHYVSKVSKVIINKRFNIIDITSKLPNIDTVYCVSENLLPLQSQLESYYNISNLSPFAAEVLSNKQLFDDFCRSNGLGEYVPNSITPTFHDQLNVFKNKELFSKPDIGTGSNIFYPGDDHNNPSIEYRRWNNKHHFLKHLKDKGIHNEFFALNKEGIHSSRFNYKPCRVMFQEYFWSTEPSISPYGCIRDGKVNIAFYVKNSKIKYGDLLDPNSNPIESHSVSKSSDIVRERAVWIETKEEVDPEIARHSLHFLQTLVDKLKIKNLLFAGPDFHIDDNNFIAIDFNPRMGQFINILDRLNNNKVVKNMLAGNPIELNTTLLWGCAVLRPGKIKSIKNLDIVSKYFNMQNTMLTPGTVIPEFQNLQNKTFNINLDILGNNQQELFDNYVKINKLLQDCIVYE
jgi:hypothetical protein